jgi:multiple sugar transport system ATP-binding protein
VRSQLKQLFEQQQKPVVYVTHDQTEAMTLSSKVAVLADGLVQQLDPPVRIYTHPANQFVAAFVGSPQMNLLTLACEAHSAVLGHTAIPLPSGVETSRQIVLGIRPEAVQLANSNTTEPRVRGKIYLVEELGKERLISVELESGVTIRALISIEQELDSETVSLSLPTSSLHWFEPSSGNRL